ncbi:hypothetical protein COO60DRAFT_1464969 [Scenedesmus sp. NREL 46B-D3]|nr:hypothetical protein COO60DRAFT_1464969 [Scenedesmus sp. NREL 46B-D3]
MTQRHRDRADGQKLERGMHTEQIQGTGTEDAAPPPAPAAEHAHAPFHNELRKRIQAAGVRIINESAVSCLSDIKQPSQSGKSAGDISTSKYAALTTTGSGWRAERLMLNPVPRDMLKIQGSLARRLARGRLC